MKKPKKQQILFNRQNGIALAVLILSLLVYWWLREKSEINLLAPEGLRETIQDLGSLGIVVYISLIALAVIMSPIPGAPLTIAAGAVWGTLFAGIYSVIGGFLGGLIAYFIGRTLGRSAVYALTGKVIYFTKNRGEVYLGWLILITRLLPVLSFDLISYGAGITGLSLPIYATATLLGMIPSTFFLTYMGAAFQVGKLLGVGLLVIFVIVLVALPWGIRRYNWFNLQDIIRIE
ncbi:SNARE associated Golgi family protein (plasmid) [Stanieria cyanosphaera PCC 7437]|uniref:TVP38/TMEM64 family membrane protein n=1 Tax=Stanieria cyanosphaera (strain ATCC 29371 / PCC 7437) TaxID=111780 RepID=K9Y1K8_STAC7|nr:TVP38/TMEM64 family protein [Stanieria cyanosphaera]AFZ38214.1 SNARE associated Golgi family protein [Stanieria cyanosphaera PCC 7437]